MMVGESDKTVLIPEAASSPAATETPGIGRTPETREEVAALLRQLRRRHARSRLDTPLTYRELAARTGWSVGVISDYFTGKVLAPTDRFDTLIRLLGASPVEQGVLATARDRAEEKQRRRPGSVAAGGRGAASAGGGGSVVAGGHMWEAAGGEQEASDGEYRPIVPHQLPSSASQLVGRQPELAALTGLAEQAEAEADAGTGTAVVAVIDGAAGVGKTALALYWAHRETERFPDGQLYVNLRGFDPAGVPVTAGEALGALLVALDVPTQRVPEGLQAQAALYRSLLTGRRMLVVLDNARDAEQVRPLLPAGRGSMAVVTSRGRLSSLIVAEGAACLTLDLLTSAQARQLLSRRLGAERVAAEPDAVDDIIARCGRLPLGMTIAAARAATHARFPLAAVAAELGTAHRSLDAFGSGDPVADVRTVFSCSYRQLSAPAARLFRLMGLHPGPDISLPAAASLAASPPDRVLPLLSELSGLHLAAEHLPRRYVVHDLLRAYATELAADTDPARERDVARTRVLDHYLHTAYAADRLFTPIRYPIALTEPAAGTSPESFTDSGQAAAWFIRERQVLLAAVGHAAAAGLDRHVYQLGWVLLSFLGRRGTPGDRDAVQRAVVTAAERLADPIALATAHCVLAVTCLQGQRPDDAITHLRQALELYRLADYQPGAAYAHSGLGMALEQTGRYADARRDIEHALGLFREIGDERGVAASLANLGWLYALDGDHRSALGFCEQALPLHQRLDNHDGEAATWDSLGYIHHRLGEYGQAADCCTRALAKFRYLGDRYGEATALTRLGDVHRDASDLQAARSPYRQALQILEELQHVDAEGVRHQLAALDRKVLQSLTHT